jgi:cytochrome P450
MLNEALRHQRIDTGAMTCPYPTPSPPLTVLNAAASTDRAAMQAFYADLRERYALRFDPDSNSWIAANPALAQAALLHPDLGVRPPGQAVPAVLRGRPLGAAFALWLRMRDDTPRAAEKLAVQAALDGLDPAFVQQVSKQQADLALPLGWSHWQWASLPCSVASLLGFGMHQAADQQGLLARLAALALALKPQAEREIVDGGDQAVVSLVAELQACAAGPLAQALQTQARELGLADTPSWWQAQALALLWQGYEAGAGLLGQALLAAARSGASVAPDLASCTGLLQTVAHAPGVIHHTRRWALRDCVLGGQPLRAGEAVLVVLACKQHAALGFGQGRHQCPASKLSLNIAAAALWQALEALALRAAPQRLGHEALANARVPIFSNFNP